MGRQLPFTMLYEDEIFFLSKIREKFNVKIIYAGYLDRPELIFTDELIDKDNRRFRSYIWNTDFSYTPKFHKCRDGSYRIDKSDAPLIDFDSGRTYGNGNYGRIYWENYYHDTYDFNEFGKWYDKLSRLLKKYAVHSKDEGIFKHYFYENAWNIYGSILSDCLITTNPEVPPKKYYSPAESYKNVLLLKFVSECQNNCKSCKCCEKADYDDYNYNDSELCARLHGAFDGLDKEKYTEYIVGAYSEPLTASFILDNLFYVKNKSRLKITVITNGLTDKFYVSQISGFADRIIVFIDGEDPEHYLINTDSTYGLSAYNRAVNFAGICKRSSLETYVIHGNREKALGFALENFGIE